MGGPKFVSYLGPAVDMRSSFDSFGIDGHTVGVVEDVGDLEYGREGGLSLPTSDGGISKGFLSFASSLRFAASFKSSIDPLGANGPSVDRGKPVGKWRVYVPPEANLRVVLRLVPSMSTTDPDRFLCCTFGPLNIYRGMGVLCQGLHLADKRLCYIITRLLYASEADDRIDVEVVAYNRISKEEDPSRGPYILHFRWTGVTLVGFEPAHGLMAHLCTWVGNPGRGCLGA